MNCLKYLFFAHCAKEWGKLSKEIRNIDSINKLKFSVLNFIRPRENSGFSTPDIKGVKLLNYLLKSLKIGF